ncbi:MAG: hydroxysqualene dehydroxylase HpnE [Pseudomonadota bacterium]
MSANGSRCHVIGAGLAGLSAAVRLAEAGRPVSLHEGAAQAGGRCRSYFDARLDRTIDNGNHLVLSGNHSAMAFLETIGASNGLTGDPHPEFPFVDLATRERWAVRPNAGFLPWWVVKEDRRIPGTTLSDYLGGVALALAGRQRSVADIVPSHGVMAHRFWEPFTLAVMNAPPDEASARLLWTVIRETFLKGGERCVPQFTRAGLGAAFIEPALAYVCERDGGIRYGQRLLGLDVADGAVDRLRFKDGDVSIAPDETVVLAVSPAQLRALLPDLNSPEPAGVIVNAHFVVDKAVLPDRRPPFIGVLNASTQWIFWRDDIVSITISAAGALGLDRDGEDTMLPALWSEVCQALGLAQDCAFQAGRIVKEKRATFDQSPQAIARRPATRTPLSNLMLAGDVIDTGLPATIEGAIRSGEMAADAVLART